MNTEILETERLFLRGLTPQVYAHAFSTMSDRELKRFFGCVSDEDLAEERKKHEEGLSMYRKSFLVFQLLDKMTNSVIGWCGYHTWYLLHLRAEIGYVLTDETYKGRGLMKEALPPILHYGFHTMGLQRVEAFVAQDNIPSLKLITSLGFVQEGRLREHYLVNDRLEDSLLFSLLKREYNEPVAMSHKVIGVFY